MKLFRCENPECGTNGDFEADVPVCPACQADGRLHSALVTELVPVHYFATDKDGPIRTAHGNRRIPCMPNRAKLPKSCTGHRPSVTCPGCKASALFKAHEAGEVETHVPFIEKKIAEENGLKEVTQG